MASLERKATKSEKIGRFFGVAYAKAKHSLKTQGGKAKEIAKRNASVVKSAVKAGFVAGLRAASRIKIQQKSTRKRRKKTTKKAKITVRRRRR